MAGPYCGKLLAGLGADVVKLEPPGGDSTRLGGPFRGDVADGDRSGLFLHLNTGKRSAVVSRAERDALFGWADVLLTSGTPGALAAADIDIDELRRRHPGLVITNVSTFGLAGPYSEYRGEELVAYAMSGYMMLTGEHDREPIKAYGPLIQYQAGVHAALGTMAALFSRRRWGRGQVVDASAMEAGSFLLGGAEQSAHFSGSVTRRNGTRLLGFHASHPYPSTIRPCADGYVHCHANNHHRDLLGVLIGDERLRDPDFLLEMTGHADEIDAMLDEWLSDKTRTEAVRMAQEVRLPFTEVMEPGEVMDHPTHRERGSFVEVDYGDAETIVQVGPPLRMTETPWRMAAAPALDEQHDDVVALAASSAPTRAGLDGPPSTPGRPLEGIRVVDFTVAVAGPLATAQLGDLGAEVIKIEATNGRSLLASGAAPLLPGHEDRPYDRLMVFNQLNHAKRSLSLDVASNAGREVFIDLVRWSDVVVQNFSPRVMGNLGLDYETLARANPTVILVSMPAFGLGGGYRDRGSYGPGIDAMSGLSHLTGYADGPPLKPGNFFCDQNAAIHSAFATLAALWHRDATGKGQHVELPMIDGEFQVLGDAFMDCGMNGRQRMRRANRHDWMAPHDVYRAAGDDSWLAIAVASDAEWAALATAMGRPELAGDRRFSTRGSRKANESALRGVIEPWSSARDHVAAQDLLQAAGVAAGAVLTTVELLDDPHVRARRSFSYVDSPGVGPAPCPRAAFTLDETPVHAERAAPGFGEGNDYVLRELLGYDDDRLRELREAGVVSDVPVPNR